jgi:dihydroxyacetone kinase-like protein
MGSLSVLNQEDFIEIFLRLSHTFETNSQYLSELDTGIGDGDHGFSMAKGFHEIAEKINAFSDLPIGQVFRKAGFILINSIGGAAGAVFGTFFLGLASCCEGQLEGKESLNLMDLVQMMQEALRQVEKRGNALPGDKTMLDALEPAVNALMIASQDNLTLNEAFQNAAQAAWNGAKATKAMQARRGRARNLGERSIGFMDPGAMSIFLILKTISGYIDDPLSS